MTTRRYTLTVTNISTDARDAALGQECAFVKTTRDDPAVRDWVAISSISAKAGTYRIGDEIKVQVGTDPDGAAVAVPLVVDEDLKVREPTSYSLRELLRRRRKESR